ncbi:hypothetical protein VMB_04530 [Vibrio mimicus VM603]|uniref:Uncharacterized protein n=1 Tax=Vibrio mimicus VM603 TaxID=671074 RepID=D2YAA6_VIBMI|nr:hypothetical protein [Vibrio mimicus]EEW08432.1 hypothetical protein VMB_04530 [Vibrio mimicus VM603]
MFQMSQLPDLMATMMVYLFWVCCAIAIIVCIKWVRHVPYRVVLKQEEWKLQHRDNIFDDWTDVASSESKSVIQNKAREALFAHYRFKEFVSGVDIEIIRDAKVISE